MYRTIKLKLAWLLALSISPQLATAQPPPRPSSDRPSADRPSGPAERNSNTWDSFWKKLSVYDADQDGTIAEMELGDPRLRNLFTRADSDHDKQVTQAEWRACFELESKTFNVSGRGRGGGGPPEPPGGQGGRRGPGGRGPGSRGRGPGERESDARGSATPSDEPTLRARPDESSNGTAVPPEPRQQSQSTAASHNWNAWHGEDGNNVLKVGKLPVTWSPQENIAWRSDVPGYGWSSPIVVGNRVVITTAIDDHQTAPEMFGPGSGHFDPPDRPVRFCVLCYDLFTGKELWAHTLAEKKPQFAIHPTNTYATETAVSDGQSIFVRFGELGVACYDLDGQLKWRKDIGPYRMQGGWGTASNPLLTRHGLILQVDSETDSYVTLLSKEDGKVLWRVDRRERSAWSSPYLWRNSLRDEVVLIGAKSIRAYDPANGQELWSLGATGRSDTGQRNNSAFEAGSCKASPTGDQDLLLVGKGNRAKAGSSQFGPFWAVKPGGSGDINLGSDTAANSSNKSVKWYREDAGPVIASPLLVDGLVYIMPRNGSTFYCLDAHDGSTVYSQALGREQYFFVTPWSADGKVYASSGSGKTFVFKSGPTFELLATNDLDEHCYAAPALLEGALIFRTATQLYCIGTPSQDRDDATTQERKLANDDQPSATQTSPASSLVRSGRGGRQGTSRLIEFALAIDSLTGEQRAAIEAQVALSKQRAQDQANNAGVPRAAERNSDDLRRGIEAVLDDAQKKALRTRLAEGSGDPGAANGGPITTLREQLAQIGLTAEQDFAVQSLVLELRDDIGKAVGDPSQNRGTAIRTITEATKQKILAVLTDEQREKLRKLQRR